MDKNVVLARIKCENACMFTEEKTERDYFIEGVDFGDRDYLIKKNSLLIDLIENEAFGCNLKKIKE